MHKLCGFLPSICVYHVVTKSLQDHSNFFCAVEGEPLEKALEHKVQG